MKRPRNAVVTVILLAGTILLLTIADLYMPDRLFSEYENRILASRPSFSLEALLKGSYSKDYETYVTDQFAGRDSWIFVKTTTDVLLGKKEINGVYLAKDGTLIEKHAPESVTEEMIEKRLKLLQELAGWQAGRRDAQVSAPQTAAEKIPARAASDTMQGGALRIMLVPTADNILTDRLPAYADYYRQEDFLERVEKTVSDGSVTNVTGILKVHKDGDIYYGTDHHWTTLGAFYGYQMWAESMELTQMSCEFETVSEDFLGTLHSKTNLAVEPDTIKAYVPQYGCRVYYDFAMESRDSLYEEKYLTTKNQYGYFLDDNHAFIRIEVEDAPTESQGRSIFVIKDSFANCFVPFLTAHYESIYMLDLRYYRGRLFPLMEEFDVDGGMDVLVLYNVVHFLEEFQFY